MNIQRTLAQTSPSRSQALEPPTGPPQSHRRFWSLRGPAGTLLTLVLGWRVSLLALAQFSKMTLTASPEWAHLEAGRSGLGIWKQWDANYFLQIAAQGYVRPEWPAFFPLYPMFVRAIYELSFRSLSFTAAGILANLLLMAALVTLLWRLAQLLLDRESAHRSVVYLLLFPTAVFLAAPYSEPTLLVTVVASFLAAQKKRWALAGAMGALAALARPTGLVMLPVLLFSYLEQNRFKFRKLGLRWIWIALVPVGTLSYFLWLAFTGKGFFGYFQALEIGWPERRFSFPITPFDEVMKVLAHEPVLGGHFALFDMAAILGVTVITILGFKVLPKAYTLYASLMILSILVTDITAGAARYVLGIFPIFLLLAKYGQRQWIDRAILTIFVPLLGLFTAMYSLGYWVG